MTTQANSLPETWKSLHTAISTLASVCDGAIAKDGMGFAGPDVKFGHRAAAIPIDEWTLNIAADAYKMLRTYKVQLSAYGIDYSKLVNPDPDNTVNHNAGRQDAREAEYKRTHAPYITVGDDKIIRVYNSYPVKDELKPARKNGNPLFRFSGSTKTWDAILCPESAATILGVSDIQLEDDQREMLESLASQIKPADIAEKPFNIRVGDDPRKLVLETDFGQIPLAIIRGIPGRKWLGNLKVNLVDPNPGLLELAKEFNLTVSDEAKDRIEQYRAEWEEQEKRNREAVAESIATETDMTDIALSDHLYPFQRAGSAYAIKHLRGTIIADEMGLGKTRQALATAETTNSYPLLVICPPSVKFVWLREIENLLPHRTAAVYFGRLREDEEFEMPEDILIMGYPSVASYYHNLPDNLGGVVCDESHYIKNPKASRTKAVLQLMGYGRDAYGNLLPTKLRSGGMRTFLTGTPVLNRPVELVQPLIALGILTEQRGLENSVGKFLYTYCKPERGYKGHVSFNGLTPGMGEKLNTWLRQTCMVRRTKKMVLTELPPKIRAPQFIALDESARETYNRLERVGAEEAAETRAAAIVYLNKLRSASGTSKISQAVGWITDFLETTDKSLVVFANHKNVQHGIIDALNSYDEKAEDSDKANVTYILGGQSAQLTEDMKEKFQAKESRVIVLSFDAAREGHTLTAASDVLFTELGWNPGTHNQAEDRCHRIGQEDSVTAYYLIAMDTVDEDSHALIEEKRQVVDAVTDGVMRDDSGDSIFTALLDRTLGKHGVTRKWGE